MAAGYSTFALPSLGCDAIGFHESPPRGGVGMLRFSARARPRDMAAPTSFPEWVSTWHRGSVFILPTFGLPRTTPRCLALASASFVRSEIMGLDRRAARPFLLGSCIAGIVHCSDLPLGDSRTNRIPARAPCWITCTAGALPSVVRIVASFANSFAIRREINERLAL